MEKKNGINIFMQNSCFKGKVIYDNWQLNINDIHFDQELLLNNISLTSKFTLTTIQNLLIKAG